MIFTVKDHNLIPYQHELPDHYICTKCDIIIYNSGGAKYKIKNMNKTKPGEMIYGYEFISCAEEIIKNILE